MELLLFLLSTYREQKHSVLVIDSTGTLMISVGNNIFYSVIVNYFTSQLNTSSLYAKLLEVFKSKHLILNSAYLLFGVLQSTPCRHYFRLRSCLRFNMRILSRISLHKTHDFGTRLKPIKLCTL